MEYLEDRLLLCTTGAHDALDAHTAGLRFDPNELASMIAREEAMRPAIAFGPSRLHPLSVTVHALGSSEGELRLWKWASTVWVTNSNTFRCCWRQVSMVVNRVSTKRLPAALCVPKESFRQITA
jgi:hypothetical protein